MKESRVGFQGRIQQRHGLNGDFNSEFFHRSCQYFQIKQAWNMGAGGGVAEQITPPYMGPETAKPSISMIGGFESPTSAFYAAETCMGFSQHHSQSQVNTNNNNNNNYNNNLPLNSPFSKIHDLELPLYQSPRVNHFLEHSPHQPDSTNVQFSDTLQAMLKSQFNSDPNPYCGSPEKPNKISCGNFPITKFLPFEQHNLFNVDDAASARTRRNHIVGCGSYNLPVSQLSFSSQQEKLCSPTVSANGNYPTSGGTIVSSKTRIRWTQDLHEKFVECVNRLGGAEKATPKAILKLMDSDGLTIFHVKSHLQKYRIAKYMPDPAQGKSEKRTHIEDGHHMDVKTGMQIREALQLQLDVQRRLHEQLEIQRKLQLRIEEQGKQLKMMFDQQQKTSSSLLSTQNLGVTPNDDDASGISLKEFEASKFSEGTGNSFFPSKIS
ncbi:myb family transcription factor PHL5-like [Senna tora]|uniref:Myb family transcription factor PHL5-like n=1 Tax=Senna tora TaxID=362788 RepID=A0A834SKG5_9FABA|nr:myb family transcription factor PHL5-like [Senna tora]